MKLAAFLTVLSIACPVAYAGLFESPVPEDIRAQRPRKFQSVDEIAKAFAQAGTKVRWLENGQVIDIPYQSNELSPLVFQNMLERLCPTLQGHEGDQSRLYRLQWHNLLRGGPYLRASGGALVKFGEEADAAERQVKGDALLNWYRERGAERSSTRTMGDAVCVTYGPAPRGYPDDTLPVKPLFVAINRCETTAKDGLCHWILLKPSFLVERVRQTMAKPPAPLTASESKTPANQSMVTVPLARTAEVSAQIKEAEDAQKRGDHATMLRIMGSLAEQGDAGAQYALGALYMIGDGIVTPDDRTAARWLLSAAKQGEKLAQAAIGEMSLAGRGIPQSDEEAVRWFRRAGDQGVPGAQLKLGSMYIAGRGVPVDETEAAKWLLLAAKQGNAEAQGMIGPMYRFGRGVPQDDKAAAQWTRLAADQGVPGAQQQMGAMYFEGQGVPKDGKEAARWLLLAAKQGNIEAQAMIGMMYMDGGLGVGRNYSEAARWLRLASDNGEPAAQSKLGLLYVSGNGVQKDAKEAAKWFQLAAAKGNAESQLMLGIMYRSGEGVVKDYTESVRLLRLAANQGNAVARAELDAMKIK